MIGVAALSLAACGSGGGESTDLAKVKERETAVARREAAVSREEEQARKDRAAAAADRRAAASDRTQARTDRTQAAADRAAAARERTQAAQRQPTPPASLSAAATPETGFGDFSYLESIQLSNRLNEAAFNESRAYTLATLREKVAHHAVAAHALKGKFIKLTPAINGRGIDYTLSVHASNETSKSNSSALTDSNKEFEITSTDYVASSLDLGLGNRFTAKTITGGNLEEWTIMESEGSSRVDSYRS